MKKKKQGNKLFTFPAILVGLSITAVLLTRAPSTAAPQAQLVPGPVSPAVSELLPAEDETEPPPTTAPAAAAAIEAIAPQAEQPVVLEQGTAPDGYLDGTIFVGDSRTRGYSVYKQVKSMNVYAKDGLTHIQALNKEFIDLGTGKKLTIVEAIELRKPTRIVVSFGINGIDYIGQERFFQKFSLLVEQLQAASPNSDLIIQAILPVSSSREGNHPEISNKLINSYNQKLQDLAEEKGVYYLAADQALKNSSGALDSRYNGGDGLHFNKKAYQALVDYYVSHPIPGSK